MSDFAALLSEFGITQEDADRAASELPEPLKIEEDAAHLVGPSSIEGLGAFSGRDIAAYAHACTLNVGGKWTVCGRYANHSDTPNLRAILDGRRLIAIAARQINRGDELTLDYRQVKEALPGPAFLTKGYAVVDGFCVDPDGVRASVLDAGIGTWLPNRGAIGSSIYEGMGFWGQHSKMVAALTAAMGCSIFPNAMFFRVTRPGMERAYIHSDRDTGAYTCVCYLSDHDEDFGTAFYRHKATGLTEMPSIYEVVNTPHLSDLKRDITEGGEKEWERLDYVGGLFNRAVIFHAPLFHSRMPLNGIGTNDEDSRMVWACHFHTTQTITRG